MTKKKQQKQQKEDHIEAKDEASMPMKNLLT